MSTDFRNHNFGFWKWVVWAVITLPLSAYVLKSTHDLWPTLIWMALFSAIAIIGTSFYAAVYTTENAPSLRNVALTALGVMELALFANAAAHGGGARAFENASAARQERQIDENRGLAIEKEKAAAATKLSEARTKEAESLAAISKQDAIKIDSANRYAKRTGIKVNVNTMPAPMELVSPAPVETPEQASTVKIDTDSDLKAQRAATKQESPAETRDWWFWPIFIGLLGELGAAIGGGYKITRAKLQDSNSNQIPDWKEELAPEELRERFPHDYEMLYGQSKTWRIGSPAHRKHIGSGRLDEDEREVEIPKETRH